MLKLNSSDGKLDITITDDSLFGTGKKGKAKPHKGNTVTRQLSHAQAKQKTKLTSPAGTSDKGPRGTDLSKPVKKEVTIKQSKAKIRQGKNPRPLSVSNVIVAKTEKSKPYDADVTSKTHLDNILLMLNTEGASTGRRVSPEQLKSQLMTSLGKSKLTERKGNEEVCVKPYDDNLNEERKESISSKTVEKEQETENEIYKTVQIDAEDKRLQWKRELDEQVLLKKQTRAKEKKESDKDIDDQYNPWGRPGAGAPIRSQSGNVLANYNQRPVKKQNDIPKNENITAKATFGVSLVLSSHTSSTVNQSRSSPVITVGNDASDVKTTIPVAMRSSFAIGAPGIVAQGTQAKRVQEIQWKQELQKQIEEKKERERQRKLNEAKENLPWNAKQQKPSPQQQYLNDVSPPQRTTDISSQVGEAYENKPCEHVPLRATQDSSMHLLHASLNGIPKTHARGFGMQLMDPQAKEEAEKKRLKMLEHQHAIQEQVEEKRRIKQREREQRLKDEAIEEARFAEEREKRNKAFVTEQKQKREKEEEAKRMSEALQQTVSDAYKASQQAKADNRRRKHMDATGQHKKTEASMSRSHVVSKATSEVQHIVPDSVPGIPGNSNMSIQSNYGPPQVSGRKTPRSKTKYIGRTSQASTDRLYDAHPTDKETETAVPPLNFTGRSSPPVPTLRNKIIEKYDITPPKSCSTFSPAAIKSNLHRTVSSYSEPCDGSIDSSVGNIGTNGSNVRGILTNCDKPLSYSGVVKNDEEFNLSFSTLEDAFMIPFHRTDSATLPALPETPEPNPSQGMTNVSPRVKKEKEINTQRHSMNAMQNNRNSITAIYRTMSSHLKPDRAQPETSPSRTKGNKNIQARQHSHSTKSIPSHRGGTLTMESDHKLLKNKNTQQRQGKRLEKKALKDHRTARNDASSVSSTHQIPPELLQTSRQEMILQQLAALRQGLIIKERELKQDPIHRFDM